MKKIPLIILTGPTAVGKTDLSIKLSKSLNAEIISADSMQIYKYMDIGSAKVTKEEMDGVIHYMIDEVTPDVSFSVSEFQMRSEKYIEEINKILEYRSVENKFFNSILQTKEDPYETIFNISYDVENSSKVFLKILLLTPRQIYFIFCLPISAIDFIFAISFYITEIYTISPKRLKKICVIFYLFKNRLIRNTYNNFTFGRYNMCFLVLNIYVNNITDKYLYVFRIYHYIDELIIFV